MPKQLAKWKGSLPYTDKNQSCMPHGVIKMKILEDVSTRSINKLKFHKTIKLVNRKVKKSPTRNAYRTN
jgi:hypothetical protein